MRTNSIINSSRFSFLFYFHPVTNVFRESKHTWHDSRTQFHSNCLLVFGIRNFEVRFMYPMGLHNVLSSYVESDYFWLVSTASGRKTNSIYALLHIDRLCRATWNRKQLKSINKNPQQQKETQWNATWTWHWRTSNCFYIYFVIWSRCTCFCPMDWCSRVAV